MGQLLTKPLRTGDTNSSHDSGISPRHLCHPPDNGQVPAGGQGPCQKAMLGPDRRCKCQMVLTLQVSSSPGGPSHSRVCLRWLWGLSLHSPAL